MPSQRPTRRLAPNANELRLLGKVARMYHERGVRQPQIAAELGLSQARVSRLLKQAADVGIVRTIVMLPDGVHTDLEEQLQDRYSLRDVVVVDAIGAGDEVIPALAAAASAYLDVTLTSGHLIGISSWSETLLAAVRLLPMKRTTSVEVVVQLVGGLGLPGVQIEATSLLNQFAEKTGARPLVLPTPGVVDSAAVRLALMNDGSLKEVTQTWAELTDVLLGIGSLDPSPLLARSGNAFSDAEQAELRRYGAVGDVCFRFFNADGRRVDSPLDQRVIGVSADQLLKVPRRIGVAGGQRKYAAIRAALLGGWVNVLITDLSTAQRLADEPPEVGRANA